MKIYFTFRFNKYTKSAKITEAENQIKRINPKCEILKSVYQPVELENQIDNKKIFALSAIGNPAYFYKLIENQGGVLVGKVEFPDHHNFSLSDKGRIERLARNVGCDLILTTDKDWVKLRFLDEWHIPILPVSIELKLLGAEQGEWLRMANRRFTKFI